MGHPRRVVITGMGVVTSLGDSLDPFWSALCAGKSGIGPLTLFDTTEFKVKFGGQVRDWDPAARFGVKEARHLDRFAQFALAAAVSAVEDAGIDFQALPPDQCGVLIGSGIGGLNEFEAQHTVMMEKGPSRISPFTIPKLMVNAGSGQVSIKWGLQGPCSAVATACASAANAIGDSLKLIQAGWADVMISGGSEAAITHMGLGGFASMRALSTRNDDPTRASRPFDRDRDGFILGEGAGMLVLESLSHARRRGAVVHAEAAGAGYSSDAYHIAHPAPDGAGVIAAITRALADGRVDPTQVVHVNAHATSTPEGDALEAQALAKALGTAIDGVVVTSTKSMTGHLLGGAGAVESVAAVLALREQVSPPTINLEDLDEDVPVEVATEPRPLSKRGSEPMAVLNNAFGFGGHNVSLVFTGA
jgi:3-oxoacyl-[acyl-carrier-protein] synthase II